MKIFNFKIVEPKKLVSKKIINFKDEYGTNYVAERFEYSDGSIYYNLDDYLCGFSDELESIIKNQLEKEYQKYTKQI